MPDCAIFADTQWEPKAVYDWLNWLETKLQFPVHRVTAGNLREAARDRGKGLTSRVAAIPWHMKMADGTAAMGRRQCTAEYKVRPIQVKAIELMGGRTKGGTSLWIGISTDEAHRMKPSRVQYIANRWPLIEARINRDECLAWMGKHGYERPPKSSCIGCPYHSDVQWRELTPEEFADAVEIDRAIRNQPGIRGQQFAHRSLKPLAEVDFRSAEDAGQLSMFGNECEGMCGV